MAVVAPVSVAKQWVYALLAGHAPLAALIGAYQGGPSIFPSLAPVEEQGIHLTHSHAGWQVTTTMTGKPTQWQASWDVSAWAPGWDDQVLAPVEAEMLVALLGDELAGRSAGFEVAGVQGFLTIKVLAPLPTSGEYEAAGVWQRVSHRFTVTIQ